MKQLLVALEALPVASLLVVIFAIVGGVVVIDGNLSFENYLHNMTIAAAGLAVGRGIASHGRVTAGRNVSPSRKNVA
jgi:hypothetical protein